MDQTAQHAALQPSHRVAICMLHPSDGPGQMFRFLAKAEARYIRFTVCVEASKTLTQHGDHSRGNGQAYGQHHALVQGSRTEEALCIARCRAAVIGDEWL